MRNLEEGLSLINGNILTLNGRQPIAEALHVRQGRIMCVGTTQQILEETQRTDEVIDLDGMTVVPGLVESHMHPSGLATTLLEVDLRASKVSSVGDILEAVREKARDLPEGTWIKARGYDDTKLRENRHITREELDSVASSHPVYIKRTCGHMGVANSVALSLSGVTRYTSDPEGGHIARDAVTGELTGLLLETAQRLLSIPPYSEKDLERGFEPAFEIIAAWGLTTIHDMGVTQTAFRAYQHLMASGRLTARVRLWFSALSEAGQWRLLDAIFASGISSGFGNDMLKVMGMKFMLDGSVGGRSAAVAEGFEGEPGNLGILYMSSDELAPMFIECQRHGLRIGVHAIGERSIEVAVRAFESAASVLPLETVRGLRNRIEHCGLPTEEQLRRMKQLGLVAASSTGFIHDLGDSYIRNLGARVSRAYPMRSFIDHGIPAPGSSDCPVCNGNPLLGLGGSVTRKTQSGKVWDNVENITPLEALRAYTTLGAHSAMEEHLYGALAPGMLADITVLSKDPLAVAVDEIKDIKAQMTFVGGRKVFDRSESALEW